MKNNIELRTIIKNNKKMVTAYNNGAFCKIAKIDHPELKKISSYQLIITDLNILIAQAKIALNKLAILKSTPKITNQLDINNEDEILCVALFSSCITLYGKCFAKADGRQVKIETNHLNKTLSDTERKIHLSLIDLRNNWTAHGGKNKKELTTEFVVFHKKNSFIPAFMGVSDPMPSVQDFESLITLSNKVLDLIQDIIKNRERISKSNNDLNAIVEKLERHDYIIL